MSITNKKLITQFYYSFANNKVKSMINCYDNKIVFKDPVFGELKGNKAKQMWKMLLSKNKNIKITTSDIFVGENSGVVKWKAEYTYGKNKRKIVNNVMATFEFKDGKIIKHIDNFNFYNWSKQALGIKGLLLGWTTFFQKKIQKKANSKLNLFIKSN